MNLDLCIDRTAFVEFMQVLTARCGTYTMPRPVGDYVMLHPVSGGVDSAGMAILLKYLFPEVQFQYIFTDTLAEDPEIYATLDKLEAFLGEPIVHVIPKKGLYETIDSYNGFLPNPSTRYCTRITKLVSFQKFLEPLEGKTKYMFVGIRADEDDRIAFSIDEVETEMPLVQMGVTKRDVFTILNHTIGIPKYYTRRVRSGCSCCFFQRKSELVGLYLQEKAEFIRAMHYEKVNPELLSLHQEANCLSSETGISLNWMSLPMPKRDTILKGKRPSRKNLDLFENRGVFIGGEFFVDSMPGFPEFCFKQSLVSFSTTLHGIKTQLDDRYQHILATAEAFDLTVEEVPRVVKFAIWYLELPESIFHPKGPDRSSYTWHQGMSYAQLMHIVSHARRTLYAKNLQDLAEMKLKSELNFAYEFKEGCRTALLSIAGPVGEVSVSQWYSPTKRIVIVSPEKQAKSLPCPMCTI